MLAAAAAIAVGLASPTATANATEPPPTTGTLSGIVVDGDDQTISVSGATVTVELDEGVVEATTDANGVYTLTGVPAGTHNVTASAPGYESATRAIDIVGGENDGSFALTPTAPTTGTLFGGVFDGATTLPVAGATVGVDGTGLIATTTSGGSFSFAGVPAGSHSVTVAADGYETTSDSVDVVAGETTRWDVALTPTTGTLSGTVYDGTTNDDIAGGATVTVDGGGTLRTATTEVNGTYVFEDVPVGTYDVTATAQGYDPQSVTREIVGGETTDGTIALTPTAPTTGEIYGTVYDVDTDNNIADATVTVDIGGIPHTATTDAFGFYVFEDVPVGTYDVTASAQGYDPQSQTVDVTFALSYSASFGLTPTAPTTVTLFGKVYDATTNSYIAGATVTVDGGGTLRTDTTDVNGTYVFEDVPVGTYDVTATAQGYDPQSVTRDIIGGETGTTNIDFALNPVTDATGQLSGTVTDADTGEPIAGASVRVGDDGPGTSTASDGTYSVIAPVGTWDVTVAATGYETANTTASIVEGETTTLDVTLDATPEEPATGTLTGTIFEAGTGAPIDGATVDVGSSDGFTATTETGSLGSYRFDDLPAGSYEITVTTRGYDVATAAHDVASNQTTIVDFGLTRPATSRLAGTVSDVNSDLGIIGATVTIDEGGTPRTATTDVNGHFVFENVPAGTYDVTATAEGYDHVVHTVDVAGENTEVNFELQRAGTLIGTVFDADTGMPIDGATVTLDGGTRTTTTGSNGGYEFDDVLAGSHGVTASAPGYEAGTHTFDIVDETVPIDFHLDPAPLPPSGSLSGTVFDAGSDAPISDAAVSVVGLDVDYEATAFTGSIGGYGFDAVPAGSYEVTVSADGYASAVVDAVVADETTVVDVALQPATTEPDLQPTRISLNVEPEAPVEGDEVVLTAVVETTDGSPAEATGTVEFFDGDSSLGVAELGSPAVLTVSELTAGDHQLRAVYSGDDTSATAVSDVVAIAVASAPAGPAPTTTTTTATEAATPGGAAPGGTLPATGSSSLDVAAVAGGVLAAGVATLLVGTRLRRPITSRQGS